MNKKKVILGAMEIVLAILLTVVFVSFVSVFGGA